MPQYQKKRTNEFIQRNNKYGCIDCLHTYERYKCRFIEKGEQCPYAEELDKYASYREYLKSDRSITFDLFYAIGQKMPIAASFIKQSGSRRENEQIQESEGCC